MTISSAAERRAGLAQADTGPCFVRRREPDCAKSPPNTTSMSPRPKKTRATGRVRGVLGGWSRDPTTQADQRDETYGGAAGVGERPSEEVNA